MTIINRFSLLSEISDEAFARAIAAEAAGEVFLAYLLRMVAVEAASRSLAQHVPISAAEMSPQLVEAQATQ